MVLGSAYAYSKTRLYWALIKLTSAGPVFFCQKRLGQYGKPFTFLKFRSMYANNDPKIHQEYVKNLITTSDSASACASAQKDRIFKIQDDPREREEYETQ